MPEYEKYPRPTDPYYDLRHDLLSQGTILENPPSSVLGPQLPLLDPVPEGVEVPVCYKAAITLVFTWGFGMIVSNTCDFRRPKASDVLKRPQDFPNVYYRDAIRVAPIAPLRSATEVPDANYPVVRQYDNYRRFVYLPEMVNKDTGEEILPESLVLLNLTDVLHVDLVRRLRVVAQLTFEARRQLARKLVYHATGDQSELEEWDPDME
jgi:hypothetical protein